MRSNIRMLAASSLLLAGMLAGCGLSPASAKATAMRVSAGHRVTSAGASRCAVSARITAGMAVAPWRLAAVSFLSSPDGVAVTSPLITCDPADGSVQAQPVLVTVSTDGGRRWVTQGRPLAPGSADLAVVQMAALSVRQVWVFTGTGRLLGTVNGGASWTTQQVPAGVVQVVRAGDWMVALSCSPAAEVTCHPGLYRMPLGGGKWQPVPFPEMSVYSQDLRLVSASTRDAVVLTGPAGSRRLDLMSTVDGGTRWTVHLVPAGPDSMCANGVGVYATAAAGDVWIQCNGPGGMDQSAKALLRTADDGGTWQLMAAVTSIAGPFPTGAMNTQDTAAISAFSSTLLWMATSNFLSYSRDAGRSWTTLDSVNTGGAGGSFDVLSPADAWLLASGAGLWHTTDGLHWTQMGQSFHG